MPMPFHLSWWVLPILSGLVWLSMLLGLLLHWIVDTHRRHYPEMKPGSTVAYISHVGAHEMKPLFIAGCALTMVTLDASFLADRWLRHRGRLVPNVTVGEKVLKGLTIVFALVGTVGLVLLSVFDTAAWPRLHDIFLLLFIAGYLLSAVFICWEYQRLGIKHREHAVLRLSFWIKLVFILVELALSVAFGATTYTGYYTAAAVLEWVVAFIFSFYIFSFVIDLWPAVYTRPKGARHWDRERQEPIEMEDAGSEAGRNGHAGPEPPMSRVPNNF